MDERVSPEAGMTETKSVSCKVCTTPSSRKHAMNKWWRMGTYPSESFYCSDLCLRQAGIIS